MLNFYSDTKIYVHCPAGVVTGGAELLHQLVSLLRDNGRNAYIVYFGWNEHSIPSDYKSYNIDCTEIVDDNAHNIDVYYEGIFDRIKEHRQTQKLLWWISVDHFFLFARKYLSTKDIWNWNKRMGLELFLQRIWGFCERKNLFKGLLSLEEMVKMNVMCGYQAEYIQHFLIKSGFKELAPLKDYINVDHIEPYELDNRENIVVYNPKKGFEFTKQLIELSPDVKWVPLENMNRSDLVQTIRKAKLYVDFGYHPGKDRLPRECAMNGCCIITGMRGSAAFFEDVPLPNEYKFDENKSSKSDIVNKIRWVLDNYKMAINDFWYYRSLIVWEKSEFEQQVKLLFKI